MAIPRLSIVQSRAVLDKRLSASQFRTLATLGIHANTDTGWCYPKLKTLGLYLGKTKQAVSADIKKLVAYGYVEIRPQLRADGGRSNNQYRVIYDPKDTPCQPGIDGGASTPEIDTPSTPEIDTPSSTEVDALTTHSNDSLINDASAKKIQTNPIKPNAEPTNGNHSGKEKPAKKGDILDGMMHFYNNTGDDRIKAAVFETFHWNAFARSNETTRDFLEWAAGQGDDFFARLVAFGQWWMKDWRSKGKGSPPVSLGLIIELWPQATQPAQPDPGYKSVAEIVAEREKGYAKAIAEKAERDAAQQSLRL